MITDITEAELFFENHTYEAKVLELKQKSEEFRVRWETLKNKPDIVEKVIEVEKPVERYVEFTVEKPVP